MADIGEEIEEIEVIPLTEPPVVSPEPVPSTPSVPEREPVPA